MHAHGAYALRGKNNIHGRVLMQQTCHSKEEEGTWRRKVAHAEKVFS